MTSYSLSIIVPMFNEAPRITTLLDRLKSAGYTEDLIIVDDGSTDDSYSKAKDWAERNSLSTVRLLSHDHNRGKGAAIRTGLGLAQGDFVIIQDADLEYTPEDYPLLMAPIAADEADVVFGSRYLGVRNQIPWSPNRICVYLLNWLVRVLYGVRLTDEATCYKMFRTSTLRSMRLACERFEFCPEVTAKAARMGLRIREVAINYEPRTARDGKKIGWKDGIEAIYTLLRWRFSRFTPSLDLASPVGAPALIQKSPRSTVRELSCFTR